MCQLPVQTIKWKFSKKERKTREPVTSSSADFNLWVGVTAKGVWWFE